MYDRGLSQIAYIGSAASLRRRLLQHVASPHNWHIRELSREFGELWLAWWLLPPLDKPWLFAFEGESQPILTETSGKSMWSSTLTVPYTLLPPKGSAVR